MQISFGQCWARLCKKTTENIKNKVNLLILIIGFHRKNINIMQRRCQTDYVTTYEQPQSLYKEMTTFLASEHIVYCQVHIKT